MTIPPDLEAQILRYYHAEKWRNHAPYAKANFQFERVVTGWRSVPTLDMRHKK